LTRAEFPTPPAADINATKSIRSNLLKPAVIWFALAALVLGALYARLLHHTFDGDFQGWASSSCMTMAHSFNQLGALHTHFVPIQNNLPLGSDPDVYLHWPPLFPLLLSVITRIFGDRESSARLFALAITLVTAFVVFAIGRRLYGTLTGLLSGFFFLTARATYEGGRAILHQPLAMLFGAATVLFFLLATGEPFSAPEVPALRKRLFAAVGFLATVCTVLTAWDPIFIPLGLMVSSIYLRRRSATRLAGLYLVAAVVTFLAVQADYILSYPALFKNQFATIAYRAGIRFNADSSTRLHTIVDRVHYGLNQLSFLGTGSNIVRWVFLSFGDFTLLSGFLFLALWLRSDRRRNDAAVYMIGGLGLPWVLFFALMRNYVAIHPFPLVLGVPFLAIASGFILGRIWEFLSAEESDNHRYLLYVLVVVLPLLVLYPLVTAAQHAKVPYGPPEFEQLSNVIRNNTPENAVTLSPSESAVPVYYSERHVVRGIETPELLRMAIPQARADFPGSPLFFALQDADRPAFYRALPGFVVVARQGDSTLYSIP
jgi:4-amino-4-deoxy-L-arabinose transferase-like glycosyltransferase